MYYETFTYKNTNYFKFTTPLGDPYYCSKTINNVETEISCREFDSTRTNIEKQFLKFILFKFFTESISLIITPDDISVENSTSKSEIKYYELGNIEKKIIKFEPICIDNFINYLFKHNLSKLFINYCLSIFEYEGE